MELFQEKEQEVEANKQPEEDSLKYQARHCSPPFEHIGD
jgi:hypothetical protein